MQHDPEIAYDATGLTEGTNSPPNSEDSLALVFAERHARKYQYVHEWHQGLHWTGTHWKQDRTRNAFDMARDICREAANATDNKSARERLASAKTTAAVATFANADRRIAATTEDWDGNPDLLNTPGGVVHLPTGQTTPHDPDLKMTKITASASGGDCPRWLEFLDTTTAGDRTLQDYLQRAAGYSLTGHIREHVMLFGHGTGANGKSVFINTLRRVMGDYAMVAAPETFMVTRNEQHPTGLAALLGARLVIANETEAGRPWAESRIKGLTGGDPMAARFMRGNFFEFQPTFKLFVVGNHKPSLTSVDEAIRRRLHLIPFTHTVPEKDRDEELPDKLQSEWPGILAWAIEGARQWYEEGLNPPECVKAATAEYLDDQDSIAAWIASECEVNDRCADKSGALFASWRKYADAHGEVAGTDKWFSEQMQNKGFPKTRTATARQYKGIRLMATPDYTNKD